MSERGIAAHITARLDRAQADAIEALAEREGVSRSEALRRFVELGIVVQVALELDEELELRAALEAARVKLGIDDD